MKPTQHRSTQPDSNMDKRYFGNAAAEIGTEPHSHAAPRGTERAEHPLPSHVKGRNPHVSHHGDKAHYSENLHRPSHVIGQQTGDTIHGSSGEPPDVMKARGGPPMRTDSQGHPIESYDITSGASGRVDRMRNRTQYDREANGPITNAFHRSIASEGHNFED